MSDLFEKPPSRRKKVAEYFYRNESGEVLYKKIRYQPKSFSLARPDGHGGWINNIKGISPILYNLPDLVQGIAAGKSIYIVEGEKDVETLKAKGLVATSSFSGAGPGKWLKQYNGTFKHANVIIIQDNDTPGKQFAEEIAENLCGVAESVKLIDLTRKWADLPEHADISDAFAHERDDSKVLADLNELISQTPEYISVQQKKPEKASVVKCDEKFADLFAKTNYTAINGNTCEICAAPPYYRQLANFVAWIESEKTIGDGLEQEKSYGIAGRLCGGRKLPSITVPASEFSRMGWVTDQWGLTCNINPGPAVKDKLRHCIQQISHNIISATELNCTGWYRDPQAGWIFLNRFESIGGHDIEVRLESRLVNYYFPKKNDARRIEAIQATLDLVKIAPHRIILPLLALTFLSPLNEFLKEAGYEPRFVYFLVGTTNCFKSTLAALFLAFFGKFNGGNLPMTFLDTANAILYQSFLCKDVLTCVDDFKPSNSVDVTRMNDAVQRIIRAYGEREGRSRLSARSELMANHPPRGNVIITAEQMPNVGESGVADASSRMRFVKVVLRKK